MVEQSDAPSDEPRARELQPDEAASQALSSCALPTILVVEDDPGVRRIVARALEDLGYCVRQAADGNAALDILRSASVVDLLFTDMVMPNGLTGHELIKAARLLRPGMKVLLASGYSDQFIKMRDASRDIRLLSKPYRRDMLATAVRSALSCVD